MDVKKGVVRQKSVLVKKIRVFKGGICIGVGEVAFDALGRMFHGEFFDWNGAVLPDELYDVAPTGEEYLQIVPMDPQ